MSDNPQGPYKVTDFSIELEDGTRYECSSGIVEINSEPQPFELRDIEERVAIEEAREVTSAIEILSAWISNLSRKGGVVIHAKGASFHSWQDSTTIRLSIPDGCLEDFIDQIERYASSNPEEDSLTTLGCDAQGNVTEPGWKP